MDWQNILFNPNGRIGQGDFWKGVAIIVIANILLHAIPLIGGLIWLVLIWVGVAVYGKRLHDAGRSAVWHLLPWVISMVLWAIAFLIIGGAVLTLILNEGDVSPWAVISAGGGILGIVGFDNLMWLVYTLWVGLAASDSGENAYGPAPALVGSATEQSE